MQNLECKISSVSYICKQSLSLNERGGKSEYLPHFANRLFSF
jgi:hypothetical protein